MKQGGFRVFLKRHILGPYLQGHHSKQHWAYAQSPPTPFSDWGDVSKLQISPTGMTRWKGVFSRRQKYRKKSLDISTSMALVLLSHQIADVTSKSSISLSEGGGGGGYLAQSAASQEELLPANHSQLSLYTSGIDVGKNSSVSFWDWIVCSMGVSRRCREDSAGKKQSKLSKEREERQTNINEQNLDAMFTCDTPSMMDEVERGTFTHTMPFYYDGKRPDGEAVSADGVITAVSNNALSNSNNSTSETDQSVSVNPFFPLGTASAGAEREEAPVVDKEEEISSSSDMEWEIGTSKKMYQAIKTLVETKPSPAIVGSDSEVDLPTPPPVERALQSSSWIRFPFISSRTPSTDILSPPTEVEIGELEVTPVARESAELFEAAIVRNNTQKDIAHELASHKDDLGFHHDHCNDIDEVMARARYRIDPFVASLPERELRAAIDAASSVQTETELKVITSNHFLSVLINAIEEWGHDASVPISKESKSSAGAAAKALSNLIRFNDEAIITEILNSEFALCSLKIMIDDPVAGKRMVTHDVVDDKPASMPARQSDHAELGSEIDRRQIQARVFTIPEGSGDLSPQQRQEGALQLLLELAHASDMAVSTLRSIIDLRLVLERVAGIQKQEKEGAHHHRISSRYWTSFVTTRVVSVIKKLKGRGTGKSANEITPLPTSKVLAYKLLTALGYHTWIPKVPGQKGLRILAMDGGGSRGVLTLEFLNRIFKGTGKSPHEVFDVICGTSAGGIIAGLFAAEKLDVKDATRVYENSILTVFSKITRSTLNLVVKQAQYSSEGFENILQETVGDKKMIDTAENPEAPKLLVCSTVFNKVPPSLWVWRNYNLVCDDNNSEDTIDNLDVGGADGTFRARVYECMRATAAAPSYFEPLKYGENLLCDGAFLVNNPAALALKEAKKLYPGIPIEALVSVGTGDLEHTGERVQMGWNTIVNQILHSVTDTQGVNAILESILPKGKYFRFNCKIKRFNIDETNSKELDYLKEKVKDYFSNAVNHSKLVQLRSLLTGNIQEEENMSESVVV